MMSRGSVANAISGRLGCHKRTLVRVRVMSALPPKADMCVATRDVRYGPIADILIGRLSPKEEPRDAGL
jgi:hypothetical protein